MTRIIDGKTLAAELRTHAQLPGDQGRRTSSWPRPEPRSRQGKLDQAGGRSFRCWQQLNYGTDGQSGIVGDVVIDEMVHAEAATPVAGGVGPMTIVYLLSTTRTAAKALCHAA